MSRKRKQRTVLSYDHYPVRIHGWEVDYDLSLNTNGIFGEGPYWEYFSLKLKGELLRPRKIKGREIQITFLPDRTMDDAIANSKSATWKPEAVGSLTSRGKRSEFIGSLPMQPIASILTALQSGKIQYVIFRGEALQYGSASIRGVTFSKEDDPEDY